MAFCASCGAAHPEGASFCSSCGGSLTAAAGAVASNAGSSTTAVAEPLTPANYFGLTAATVPGQPVIVDPSAPGARFIGQWNWGAALLTPFWLMTHRRVPLGLVVLLIGFIPLVSVLNLGALIYFGLYGNRVAVLSGRYTSDTEFVAVQNAWRNWAFGVLAATIALFALAVISRILLAMTNSNQ